MQEHSQARLISIVRRPGELVALISEPNAEDPKSFEIKSTPLHAVSRSLFPRKAKLQESWQRLANATAADSDTLYHVLIVAIESAPDLSLATTPPSLPANWGDAPPTPRATSAHPRAFKGTTHQPPKQPRSSPLDVRPHLCHPGSMHALLAPMRKHLPEVQARLEQDGYSRAIVEAIEGEFPRPANTRKPVGKSYWTLPARFLQCVWPLVRWRPARDTSVYLSLYAALELESDDRLLWGVSRFIALSDADHAYSWCRLAPALPPPRRLAFVNALLETDAGRASPASTAAAHLEQVCDLAADEQFPKWVKRFLETAREDASVEYLMAGFRLSAQFRPNYSFETIGQCDDFPERIVEEFGIELADRSAGTWLPMALWERCGRFPGVAAAIRRSAWRNFKPDAAFHYLWFLATVYVDLPEASLQRKWRELLQQLPQFDALLASTPAPYQTKAVVYMWDWLWELRDASMINRIVARARNLIPRLATVPFSTGDEAVSALGAMVEMNDDIACRHFLTAPDRSFELLERACRRENDAKLIARGLDTLIEHMEGCTVEAFRVAPRQLMRTAKTLGGLRPPVRAQICRGSRQHPLFDVDPLGTPIRDVCSKILTHCGKKYLNPIPARLKSWYRGEVQLSSGSLERHQRVMAEKIMVTRLDVIEQSAIDWLKRGLPVQKVSKSGRHALRMLGDVRENRRGLRRFLQAYWSGDQDYLSMHPATLAWYRKHKAVSRQLWERGIPFNFDRAGFTIQIERNPLEILKLGTYTGTCLAVGGMCSDSAIAALLDINKKVLYARDRRDAVVARQLLAISDDDRLVCFSVYPLSSSVAVKAAFRDYDRAFASALEIPLYESAGNDDPGYQISSVLSVYWWDDGSWDFNTDQ